jgi:plasmid maintenance system antidote protein VapI
MIAFIAVFGGRQMSDKRVMEKIDGKWIEARLSGERGQKAKLAEALGVKSDKISKIIKGERQVQPEEVPVILRFFGLHLEVISDREKAYLEAFRNATPDKLAAVQAYLTNRLPLQDKP